MPGPWSSNQTHYQLEAADAGYFGLLAPGRYLQVTTSGRDGRPVPARVLGVVDGGRAYFRVRSWSGTVKRLRRSDAVRVRSCDALGFCHGPQLNAEARLLPAEEASRAAEELARKYPVRRHSLTPWLRRAWRSKVVHYELVTDDFTGDQDTHSGEALAPSQRGDQSGSNAERCEILRTHVTDHGAASIACLWTTPAQARPRQP